MSGRRVVACVDANGFPVFVCFVASHSEVAASSLGVYKVLRRALDGILCL